MIDCAENRQKFSSLLQELKIDQPIWQEVTTLVNALNNLPKRSAILSS